MSKLSRLGSIVERALVGTEKLSPELQKYVDTYTHSSGRAKELSLPRSTLLSMAIGPQGAADVLKSRYIRGGLLGPGGILLGEMAPSQEYLDLARDVLTNKSVAGGGSKAMRAAKLLVKTPMEALNPIMLAGLPAYDLSQHFKHKARGEDTESTLGNILGSNLGFFVGGPFGLAGGLGASYLGGKLGDSIEELTQGNLTKESKLTGLAVECLIDSKRL